MSAVKIELSSMDIVLLWKALRQLAATTSDPVEEKECKELLDKVKAAESTRK